MWRVRLLFTQSLRRLRNLAAEGGRELRFGHARRPLQRYVRRYRSVQQTVDVLHVRTHLDRRVRRTDEHLFALLMQQAHLLVLRLDEFLLLLRRYARDGVLRCAGSIGDRFLKAGSLVIWRWWETTCLIRLVSHL